MSNSHIKITIQCPDNNNFEREYIIKTLLEDFLGLSCSISFSKNTSNYEISFENNKICIEDHFFNYYPEDLSYLDIINIPSGYSNLSKYNLPIIFGKDYLNISDNEITCGLDFFASSFFMLTRWEEFILPKRFNGIRCDETSLFAVRNDLTLRPLVNEYLQLLSEFFTHFGKEIKPKKNYSVFITHDVDWVHLSSLSELIRNLKRMVLNQKLYKKSWLIFWKYLYYKITLTNPFDSFSDLMGFSDKLGIKNTFYFKACNESEDGFTYDLNDKRVSRIISNIENEGHHIGFHPSENTVNNPEQFTRELERLKKVVTVNIEGGRNHGLFYNELTHSVWEKNGLAYVSDFGFQYRNGFRCGICFDFFIFDVFQRAKLKLKEIPFVLLDTAFIRKKTSASEMLSESTKIIDSVKKYNGTLCMVWHSNMFKTIERRKFRNCYYDIIKHALNE